MKKVVVSASSMPAGRNMSSQLDYIKKMQNSIIKICSVQIRSGHYFYGVAKRNHYTRILYIRDLTTK